MSRMSKFPKRLFLDLSNPFLCQPDSLSDGFQRLGFIIIKTEMFPDHVSLSVLQRGQRDL